MPYKILITPAAVTDIEAAIAYYNEQATDLGYRFSALVEEYLVVSLPCPPLLPLIIKHPLQTHGDFPVPDPLYSG